MKTKNRVSAVLDEVVDTAKRVFGLDPPGPQQYRELVLAVANGAAQFVESDDEMTDIFAGNSAEQFRAHVEISRKRAEAARVLTEDVPVLERALTEAKEADRQLREAAEAAAQTLAEARLKYQDSQYDLMAKQRLLMSTRSDAKNYLLKTCDRSIDQRVAELRQPAQYLERQAAGRPKVETALAGAQAEADRLELRIDSLMGAALPEQLTELAIAKAARVSMRSRVKELACELARIEAAEKELERIERQAVEVSQERMVPENMHIEWKDS